MKKERKIYLLNAIDAQLQSSQSSAKTRRNIAVQYSDASPSQSGERVLYELSAELASSMLLKLQDLRKEVLSCPDEPATTVNPVCFLSLNYDEDDTFECFLVNHSTSLGDITLISPNSPLGQAIVGKQLGDRFMYKITRNDDTVPITGTIIDLE